MKKSKQVKSITAETSFTSDISYLSQLFWNMTSHSQLIEINISNIQISSFNHYMKHETHCLQDN
jgi:hypothetical protein